MVRSRAQYDYAEVQAMVDEGRTEAAGEAGESLRLLAEVGPLRIAREAARGGISLPLPEQQIDMTGDHWRLEFRDLLPVEEWNAQISLLTGMAAASLMVYARVGLLRTLPPAEPHDVTRLRRTAKGLGIDWPAEMTYPDFVRTLDPGDPRHAAMVVACTRLFRGSGYVGFDGELPEQPEHSALAAEYAHVTAPLRRLVDRYAGEICLALCAGEDVPEWVLERLPELPETMRETGRLASGYESAILNLMEAEVLKDRVGQQFDAVVVEVSEKDPTRGEITLVEPAIEGRVTGDSELPLGERVVVTLTLADPAARKVEFTLSGSSGLGSSGDVTS